MTWEAGPDGPRFSVPLSLEKADGGVIYELGLGPAVRLAATGAELRPGELDAIADACWRAVSRPAPRA